MALKELTEESPQVVKGEFPIETRFYVTTDLGDVPRRFASATGVDSSFPAGWMVDGTIYGPLGQNESGTQQWKVEINAIPGIDASGNDTGQDPQADEQQPEWFSISEVWEERWHETNKLTVRFPGVLLKYHVRREYEKAGFDNILLTIMTIHGKTNNAAGMPRSGFAADEWRLVAVPMEPIGFYSTRVIWTYQHAGRDYDGSGMTWTERAVRMYPSKNPETGNYDTGTFPVFTQANIFPFNSTVE